MITRSTYIEKIKPFINSEFIKVITGVRRCGKSTLLRQIQDLIPSPNKIFINFEAYEVKELQNSDALNRWILDQTHTIKDEKWYLFFDEIQEVSGWEKVINSLRLHPNFDIYVTGSNSKLLSGELATYLAGRYVSFHLYPFSYAEFKEMQPKKNFQDFLLEGGMPGSLNYEGENRKTVLSDIYGSIILKDIISRHHIRDVDLLERIVTFILGNVGRTISANSIHTFLKSEYRSISNETILNYLSYCEEACLFERVKRQDIEGKEILRLNEKIYVCDLGFRELITQRNLADIELCLENIVYFELRRHGYQVRVGKLGDKEVDFIAQNSNELHYYQISLQLSDPTTRTREFQNLAEIPDNYPKTVLSMDTIDFSQKGVEHQNIEKWLLGETS